MIAFVVLVIAVALCAGLLLAGPPAAEALVGLLSAGAQQSGAVVDTVFNLVIFGVLLVAGLIGAGLCGFNAMKLGRRPLHGLLVGALLGVTGLGAAALYARLAGSLSQVGSPGTPGLILWGSAIILFQSSAEEVFFRGWIQRVLAPHWGALVGIPVTAAVFAGLHLIGGAAAPLSVVNLFLGGLMLGLLAFDRGGLAAAIGAHFAWNWLEQIGLGLSPNPGVGSFGSLIDLDLRGASIWGGSSEGLNASLAMTFSLSAIVVALVLVVRRRPAKRSA